MRGPQRAARGGAVLATAIALSMVLGAGTASAAFARIGARSVRGSHEQAGVLVPAHPRVRLPLRGGTVDSLNWSGYAVTPGSGVSGVTGTFRVPSAGLVPPGFAATWTGIGGYTTSDLIQAGVAEQSIPSTTLLGSQYYAWYELLPTVSVPLTDCVGDAACNVAPGDQVTVTIHDVAGNTWRITVTDSTKWSWTKDVAYASSGSSAEWILEAPTLDVAQTLLAPVGTVSFGPVSTFTAAGVTQTIAQGDPTTIDLSPGIVNEATVSALAANGQSFNVCSYSQTCAAP
ncbi:MAG: G1 family endopeptidase [Actinomycetota bacterium]|nr:G1 family endopeptidase [Actinomycetota bacterium]